MRTAAGVSPRQLTALGLMTASLLGYEVLLTRAVAIQHWHHLAPVVIAVALLGMGCAGSLAAAFSQMARRHEQGLMSVAALATAAAIPVSLVLARAVPLNMLALPWYGWQQAGWLLLYALCFVMPFFSGAVFITLAFMRWASAIGRCYAADLVGSALGALLVMGWLDARLLPRATLEAGFGMTAMLPILAFLLLETFRWRTVPIAGLAALAAFTLLSGDRMAIAPSAFKALPVRLAEREARVLWQRDTMQSRLTLVQSPAQHQAPGLSIRSQREAPRQRQVFQDGDDALPLLVDAGQDHHRAFFDEVLAGAAFLAVPDRPRVLILPGNPSWDAWNAYWHGAAAMTLVEPDLGLAALLAGKDPAGVKSFLPPASRLETLPVRRFLQTTRNTYDLIMGDMGSSPVGSAATRVQYTLTREALELMLARLSPAGVLAFAGRVMPLPRDSLRLIYSLAEALRKRRLRPAEHIVVLRDWQNLLVLVSRQPFSGERLARLSAWCRRWGFDRAAMPGLTAQEANRYHRKPGALYFQSVRHLLSREAPTFVSVYPFALSVTSDNRPFFYHFFRWSYWQEIKERLGQPWMLYVGWGYLLSLWALAVLAPAAAFLIGAPMLARSLRRRITGRRMAVLTYFGAIGLGFMFIEIALLQKAMLLTAGPTHAFGVVVVALLLGAGAGSLWTGREVGAARRSWGPPLAIGILGLTAPVLIDALAARSSPGAPWLPVAVLTLFLLALAFPMGMMLPRGIARLRERGAGAVAWAWGINGFCSVLGALAAPLLAIEIGIMGVVIGAVALYFLAGPMTPLLGEAASGGQPPKAA